MNRRSFSRRRFLQIAAWTAAVGSIQRAGARQSNAPPIHDRIRKLAQDAPLRLRFHGESAEECRRWQQQFAKTLRSLLGPHQPPQQWRTVRERSVELDDHRRDEFVLVAEGHPPLPVYLLTPKEKGSHPRPGVVALHGHGPYGYGTVVGRDESPGVAAAVEQSNYDYGRQLVGRGYVVAAPCLTPFGRLLDNRSAYKGEDVCAVTFVRLQLIGKLLMAENLRDVLWSVKFLSRRDSVDPQRLGCVGLSYGGRMTMLAAALEERIRVAIISGALNVMQERIMTRYSCGAQVIPGLLEYGDVPEIASLIAPRPCLWEVGNQDPLISPEWAETALTRIRRAYHALGAENQLRVDRFDGAHRWHGRLAYPLLEEVLQGRGI
ncbi:MAG: dienelactone hydrolase family protein [Acidobacteriota bacterium]